MILPWVSLWLKMLIFWLIIPKTQIEWSLNIHPLSSIYIYIIYICNRIYVYQLSFLPLLTHWGLDYMAAISQIAFRNNSSNINPFGFQITFHRNIFLMGLLTSNHHCFRWWLGAEQVTSRYLNQWRSRLVMHLCVTGRKEFNQTFRWTSSWWVCH